ncbi:MAG: hypothetical protein KJ767_01600 [Nanoarchaeota archaeon]|nr:hypothetical protein [Nanoarchaeota archaeon]
MEKREKLRLFFLMFLILFGVLILINIPKLAVSGYSLFSFLEGKVVLGNQIQNYDYSVSSEGYIVYFKQNFDEEYSTKYKKGNTEMDFSPSEIRYTADKYIQPISKAENVEVNFDDNILYENAFGNGINLIYEINSLELKQKILFNVATRFFVPDSKILTNNPEIEIIMPFALKNSNIFINGNKWDEKTAVQTSSKIDFNNFFLDVATLTDALGNIKTLEYELRKSGQTTIIVIKIPYNYIKDAIFPLQLESSFITETEEPTEKTEGRGRGILLDLEFENKNQVTEAIFTCAFLDGAFSEDCNPELLSIDKIRLYDSTNQGNYVDFIYTEKWIQEQSYDSERQVWIIEIDRSKYSDYDSIIVNANYDTGNGFIGSGIAKSYS